MEMMSQKVLKKFKTSTECAKALFDHTESITEVAVLEVDLLNEEIPSEEEVGDSSLEEEAHQIHIKVASQKT